MVKRVSKQKPKSKPNSKPKQKPKRSTSTKRNNCTFIFTKKYQTRLSPPYPANQCQNQIKVGNDGLRYQSTSNRNGIYTWKKL